VNVHSAVAVGQYRTSSPARVALFALSEHLFERHSPSRAACHNRAPKCVWGFWRRLTRTRSVSGMPCARWPRSSRVYPQSRARNIPAREGWVLGPGERPPSYTAFHYGRNVPHRPLSGDRPSRHGRFGDWSCFLLRSKVGGRRISPFPAAKYDQLSTFGTLAGLQSQLFEIILTAPESLAYAPNSKPRSSF